MCLSKRRIKNPNDGRFYWVKCNHCDACLQEKANRYYARINKEQLYSVGNGKRLKCFFVTLTYDNDHVTYIRHSELLNFLALASKVGMRPSLNVYRNAFSPEVIDTYYPIDFENRKIKKKFDFAHYIPLCQKMPYLAKFYGRSRHFLKDLVGVSYTKDVQLFFKRLKINLFRKGYEGYFSYFYAEELGGDFKRPHIHLLVYFDDGFDQLVKSTIIESWKNSDLSRLFFKDGKWQSPIQYAINPAAYISTYVNMRTFIPPLFADAKCFKTISRFSNGFGLHFKYFTADSIKKMFDKGTLRFPSQRIRDGVLSTEYVRIPRYVLTRYFPKFKGFNNLLCREIYGILRQPETLVQYAKRLDIDENDVKRLVTFIYSRRRCYFNGSDVVNYPYAYENALIHYCYIGSRIWQLYASESIKDSYKDALLPCDLFQHFDNIQEFYESGLVHSSLVDNYDVSIPVVVNPNDFKLNRAEHSRLKNRFDNSFKHHRVKQMYHENLGYE